MAEWLSEKICPLCPKTLVVETDDVHMGPCSMGVWELDTVDCRIQVGYVPSSTNSPHPFLSVRLCLFTVEFLHPLTPSAVSIRARRSLHSSPRWTDLPHAEPTLVLHCFNVLEFGLQRRKHHCLYRRHATSLQSRTSTGFVFRNAAEDPARRK